ncbi:MAG: glycosyltransferase family 4 protein [Bryobacteraceae bacterium]|nr:glycosyltransferase family 4 protein [Bryobacteraceae bacterium]
MLGPANQVIYTAAHAVADSEWAPIGGGGAICRQLTEEWNRTRPFPFRVIGPSLAGADLVRFNETRYARFCIEFGAAATRAICGNEPERTVVLVNDIAEGPDFRTLAEAGFPIVTIYHVDVVAYVAAIYLRGLVRPETTVRWYERLRHLPLPRILDLVWARQRDSVRYSRRLIVPSAEMKHVLERCYPRDAPGKVEVLPWGVPSPPAETGDPASLRREFQVPADARVLLTLSRISPEKGQDLLLESLIEWERMPEFPRQPVYLFICGEAAFMKGERHLARLKSLAGRLRRVKTFFPGHVTGARKQAFFALADVYVFPSRHESYGLTLMEAMQAGLPAVCLDHHGAREIVRPEFGELVEPAGLWPAIGRMLENPNLAAMRENARRFAATQKFEAAAARLADTLLALF